MSNEPIVPTASSPTSRGVLYPARLPTFTRLEPPTEVAELVRWFWIPEWDLAPGRTSRQHVIAYAACNLVVEPEVVGLSGPTTRASHRDLHGSGWAVGALLRPAATRAFSEDPCSLVDRYVLMDEPALHASVSAAMCGSTGRHARAVDVLGEWLAQRVGDLGDDARLVNALVEAIDTDAEVLTVGDAASRIGVSVRTAQRLCQNHVGLPPSVLIRRRRLQEAAEQLREDPQASLATVAAELGYADHAHLTRDFQAVLGFSPSHYRDARPG